MAESFKHAAESGAMSEEEAKARFYAASGAVWFEGHTNYVFIYDTETGLCVMNAGNAALIGKDVRGLKDFGRTSFCIDDARHGQTRRGNDPICLSQGRREDPAGKGRLCSRLWTVASDDRLRRIYD